MNVNDLRKKLEGVDGDLPVVVVNDYGHAETNSGYGVGVETRSVCDDATPWDWKLIGKPEAVFVLPNVHVFGTVGCGCD